MFKQKQYDTIAKMFKSRFSIKENYPSLNRGIEDKKHLDGRVEQHILLLNTFMLSVYEEESFDGQDFI